MTYIRILFLVLLFAATNANATSMRAIETAGTLTDVESGQISSNIWSGLGRSDALLLVSALPDRYASPTYYDIARRFLLSDAPSLSADKVDPKAPVATDPDRPDMLIARLDKLMGMGAIKDAETLYDKVVPGISPNFDLAYRSLQILMLRGQLSAACLDIQAMNKIHGANPRWLELNRLCRIQFSGVAERNKLLADAEFKEYPRLGDFLRGRNLGNLRNLTTEELAFAVGIGLVNETTLNQLTSKAGTLSPLLLSVLYHMDTEQARPEKACLAIEAARRGMIGTRDLIALYEGPHYASDLLLKNLDVPPSGDVHPCMIPSVMYQRIASNKEPAVRNAMIRQAMDVMQGLPDAAFWPMAVYFNELDVRSTANKKYLWRATRIIAYEKDELPKEWASGWGGPSKEVTGGRGVSPFWPVQAIVTPELGSEGQLDLWRAQWPSEAARVASRDPAIPLLLGQSLAPIAPANGKNPKTNLGDYENIFPLTFSRSYAMPSYGLTQRLADVIEKQQTGQSVALLLIGYGAIPPDQVIPHQMALVIDGLNKAGLARYARRFALEVLR